LFFERMRRIENSRLYPWLLLTPTLIFFAIWNIVPLFWMVGMSFYNYSLNLGRPPRFVGLDNYLDYLDNVDLWLAMSRTFTFVLFSVGLTTLFGGLLGVLFWRSTRMPGRRLALTLLFSPMILTPAAIGTFSRRLSSSRPSGKSKGSTARSTSSQSHSRATGR